MAVNEETQKAVIDNARRLLGDAHTLADAGSYRTAISLAILSLEESGKACIIRWRVAGYIRRDIGREIRGGHIDKHLIFGAYRIAKAVFSVGTLVRVEQSTPQQRSAAKDPEFRAKLSEALDKYARVEKFSAELGLWDHFKQEGFYADLDDNLEIKPPSLPHNSDWFNMISEYASEAIDMATAEPFLHEIVAIIYNGERLRRMPGGERRKLIEWVVKRLKDASQS
jgi:AbiV family abortive infection protein